MWLLFPDTEGVNAAMRVFTGLYCFEQPEYMIQTKKEKENKRKQVMQVIVIDVLLRF